MTPAVFYLLASQWIEINAMSMLGSIFLQVVLFPIILGLIVRSVLKQKVETYIQVMPLISVLAIVAIVAAIIAGVRRKFLESGFTDFSCGGIAQWFWVIYWVLGQVGYLNCPMPIVKRLPLKLVCKIRV